MSRAMSLASDVGTSMKALVLCPKERSISVRDVPRPRAGPGEVLIRVHAVALNPVDEILTTDPIAVQDLRVVGTDFAGVVISASSDLHESTDVRTKANTRVSGFLQGASSENDRPGAFAEYLVAPYDLLWTVPDDTPLEEAATVSMCGLTVAQALFYRFGLPSPLSAAATIPLRDDAVNIFIYGSSTSLGLYAAQLVHLISQAPGRKIRLLGAASEGKHELLRQSPYNYDFLVDYRDPAWPAKIREATNHQGVDFALDTISEGETVEKVHSLLTQDGKYHVFRGPSGGKYDTTKLRTQPVYGAVWEGLGVEIGYGGGLIFPASPAARAFAVDFFSLLNSATSHSQLKLQPNPTRLMPGGLERIVPDGFALLTGLVSKRSANNERREEYMRPISGEKLVYRIA